MTRTQLLHLLSDRILDLQPDHVVRVAVDGVDGAGKTIIADELADVVAGSGRPIIRASVDFFHNPRAVRYRLGKESPEGFFRDYWDYSIFLDVPFEVSIARSASRDGSSPDPMAASNRRYVEGQKIYLRECDPASRATIVVDNSDLRRPGIDRANRHTLIRSDDSRLPD